MKRHKFQIFADYHQFYLLDDEKEPDYPSDVTNEDCVRRLKAAPYIAAIYTARNMTVPVTVELHATEPSLNPSDWDHVAECSVDFPSGRAIIGGCSEYLPNAARIPLQPGSYRLRAHFGALDSCSANGLEGSDHYLVALWPSPPIELKVLKEYDGSV